MAYTVRPPKEKLRIVFEGLRAENISELCRQEGIRPTDYYRYKEKVMEGALEAVNGKFKMGNYGHIKVGRSGREKLPLEWT